MPYPGQIQGGTESFLPQLPSGDCSIFLGRTNHQHPPFPPKYVCKNPDCWQKQLRGLGLSASTRHPLRVEAQPPGTAGQGHGGPSSPHPSSFAVQRIDARKGKLRNRRLPPPASTMLTKQGRHNRSCSWHSENSPGAVRRHKDVQTCREFVCVYWSQTDGIARKHTLQCPGE